MISLSNIQVSEGSVTEPVSLDEAKAWLNVDYDDYDSLLTSMITGARQDIEQELNLKLVNATASFYMDTTKSLEELTTFPYAISLSQVSDVVVSVLEDGVDDEILTGDEDYYLNGTLKIITPSRNKVAYTITPVVPVSVLEAIKMLITYRFSNRGDQEKQQGLPGDIERKISRWRQIWL